MNPRGTFGLVVSVTILHAMNIPQATGQTCRWDGTAPFCDGACGHNETEITRKDTSPGSPPAYNGPPFGSACATGSKAFCCSTPGVTCRWDGTAPFCAGSCGPGEKQAQPPAGSDSGSGCATGSKVYCCTAETHTGSTGSALQASPEFTRYAAFWDKGSGPAWHASHGLTSAQFQQEFDSLTKQGYRLVEISGYSVGDKDTYAAIWEQRQGPAWTARHGMTSAQFQQEFKTSPATGLSPYRHQRLRGRWPGSLRGNLGAAARSRPCGTP